MYASLLWHFIAATESKHSDASQLFNRPAKNGFWRLGKAREEERDKISINKRASTQHKQTRAEGSAGGKSSKDTRSSEEEKSVPTRKGQTSVTAKTPHSR